MNFPNLTFWLHLLAALGIEVCVLAALGFVAQRFVDHSSWRRAAWQITVICLLLLVASEWTGAGRGAADFLFGRKRVAESTAVSRPALVQSSPVNLSLQNLSFQAVKSNSPVWWPGCIWLAGASLVLGRIAVAQILLLVLRLRREKITDAALRGRIAFVSACLGWRRKVCLLSMPEAVSPMAFGIVRPSIGLPPGFSVKFSAEEQDAILAHELAHLAALDPLWFLLADLASAALWWHPMVWYVRRSLHGAAELAADDATVLVPDGPAALARCLVNLGREMTGARAMGWVGIRGSFRSKLGQRVEHLMQLPVHVRRPSMGWVIAAGVCVVPATLLMFASLQAAPSQKADNLREQLHESWDNSPGGLLLLAALEPKPEPIDNGAKAPDQQQQETDIPTRVKNAKFLYEMGKLDEAEAILLQVLKDDAGNRVARYYLDLIKEVRYMNKERPIVDNQHPIADANLVVTTKGRQQIQAKLESIRLNEVTYDLPLKEVLLKLRKESQARDPDGIGINFMINNRVELPNPVDPGGAIVPPAAESQERDIGSEVRVRMTSPLTNVRLADVLEAITMTADKPIRYTIQDYAVVFSPKPPDQFNQLQTKVFRVDPVTFSQNLKNILTSNRHSDSKPTNVTGLESDDGPRRQNDEHDSFGGPSLGSRVASTVTKTNDTSEAHQMVRDYFSACGVDLSSPKNVFFNDRLGVILVRATAADLVVIQDAVAVLNQAPPQIVIETRFVDLSKEDFKKLGPYWPLGSELTTNGVAHFHFLGTEAHAPNQSIPPFPMSMEPFASFMTDPQFRVILNVIEQKTREDVLTLPKIITVSGRPAHVGHGGVAVDFTPLVKPDGFSISAQVDASVKDGAQAWQAGETMDIFDGSTMVLGRPVTHANQDQSTMRLAFISFIIVDPAGNRVHDDAALLKMTKP